MEASRKIDTIYKELQTGLELVRKALQTFEEVKRGDPGLPGKPGASGKSITKEDVESAVAKLLRNPEGPSAEAVAASIMQSGAFYKLIKRRLKEIRTEKPDEEKLEMEQIMTAVREELSARKFAPADIAGFDDHVATITRRHLAPYNPSPGNARGGGDTVVAGSGVTITNNQNGNKVISTTGSDISVKIPTGTVNASNQVFGVTGEPKFVITDGITYFEGAGYSYAALQITMDVAPSQYIRYAI